MTKNENHHPRPSNFNSDVNLLAELENLRKPIAGDVPLAKVLDTAVVEGELYAKMDDGKVHCYACGHNCTIKPGARGICQVRFNVSGKLFVPWVRTSACESLLLFALKQ